MLLDLADEALTYLASLAFSDYRSRVQAPSPAVESLLEELRTEKLTTGKSLRLLRESAWAVPDSLFPKDGALTEDRLPSVERLAAARARVKEGVKGLRADASMSVIDVAHYVCQPPQGSGRKLTWWKAWSEVVCYRNHAVHSTDYRWPVRAEGYYEAFGPLLLNALVELLVHPPSAEVVLDYPIASLTRLVDNGDHDPAHTVNVEDRGLWCEHEIAMPVSVTELWAADEWHATEASSFVLERLSDASFTIRALYWDVRTTPPPPVECSLSDDSMTSEATVPARTANRGRAGARPKEGRGTAPGTCGEFIQGTLPDGTHVHVTCPMNKSSSVVVEIRSANEYSVEGLRADQGKLSLALYYTANFLDLGDVEIRVRHWSDLDIGKGMGSSTADVLSGIRALASADGAQLVPEVEGRLATEVESSDGTMYPGIAAVDHKTGRLLRRWEWYPEYVVVMLVPHDNVETASISFRGAEQLAPQWERILSRMDSAVAKRSPELFAAQAGESAALNSQFLVNPYFNALQDRTGDFGALGINVGHTGTVCGLFFPNTSEGQIRASEVSLDVRKLFPQLKDVKVVTTPHWDPDVDADPK